MNDTAVVAEIFLVAVAGYFGWLTAIGFRSGRVTNPFGSTHDRARDADRMAYWSVLGWYGLVTALALLALANLL